MYQNSPLLSEYKALSTILHSEYNTIKIRYFNMMTKDEMIAALYALTEKEQWNQTHPHSGDNAFYQLLEKKGYLINGVYHIPSIFLGPDFDLHRAPNNIGELIDTSPRQMLFRLKKGTRFQEEPMIHTSFFSIRYVYSGSIRMKTLKNEFTLKKNDLIMMNCGFVHSQYLANEEDIGLTLMFEKDYLMHDVLNHRAGNNVISRFIYDYLMDNSDPNNYVIFHGNENSRIPELMENIIHEFIEPTKLGEVLLQAYLQILLVEMMNCDYAFESSQKSRTFLTISTILDDIDQNYATARLKDYSTKYGYHPDYISRQIQRVTGMNFKDYVFHKRFTHAEELLKNTNLSIKEICERTGFSSETVFYHKFKENYGILPSAFREQEVLQ